MLTDHVFGRPGSVGWALACSDGLGALLAICGFWFLRGSFVAQRQLLTG
jgi:hypothetical protein